MPKPPEPPTSKPVQETKKEKTTDKARIVEKMKGDGLSRVELPVDDDVAIKIGASYDLLKAKGYDIPPPSEISMATLSSGTVAQASSTYINGQVRSQEIYFNKAYNKEGQGGFQDINKRMVEKGWLGNDDVFSHEYGHILHHKNIGYDDAEMYKTEKFGPGPSGEGRKNIAKKVSEYAAINPMEFVAEVFAGHINGKKYDSGVMDMYDLYGGPQLK